MVAAMSTMSLESLGGVGDVPPKEMEVHMADMETRLRKTLLRVVRPALDQVSDVRLRLEEMSKQVDKHDETMHMAELLRDDVSEQAQFIKLLTERMEACDSKHYDLERAVSEGLTELRNGAVDLGKRIDETQNELKKQGRDQQRAWEEMTRLQHQHEDALKGAWEGITQAEKRVQKIREEVMILVQELQHQRTELLEELFGENKGIGQLRRDIKSLKDFVAPLPSVQESVLDCQERQEKVEAVSAKTTEGVAKQLEDFKVFSAEVRKSLDSLKGEVQQEANRLVARHASMMKDIRWEYVDEINTVKAIRKETEAFRNRAEKFCTDTAEIVQSESRRMDALHNQIVQDMEEVSKKRKKDRMSWESEIRDTKKELEREQEMSRTLRVNFEFLSRILGLVLESQRVSSALSLQDFADRGGEKWLCLPTEAGRRPQEPLVAEAFERQRPRKLDGKDSQKQSHELVAVDFRKGLVCGEYLPGRVTFAGSAHDRRDLLLAHHRLLQRAHGAYVRGPFGEEAMPVALSTVVTGQPGANGGMAAGQVAAGSGASPSRPSLRPKFDPVEEDAKEAEALKEAKFSGGGPAGSSGGAGGGSRQRPGSQGQPQAMGSRGTAHGPLGETTPASSGRAPGGASPLLRLPSIVSDGMASARGEVRSPQRRSMTAR